MAHKYTHVIIFQFYINASPDTWKMVHECVSSVPSAASFGTKIYMFAATHCHII